MKILFVLILTIGYLYSFTIKDTTLETRNVVGEEAVVNSEEISTFAEEMPSFPGGDEELYSFISQNIKYPELAKRNEISGKVLVEFVVDVDGKIIDPKVVKGIGYGCNEEALRIVKLMPKWIPGKQDGKPIKVKLLLPIIFSY